MTRDIFRAFLIGISLSADFGQAIQKNKNWHGELQIKIFIPMAPDLVFGKKFYSLLLKYETRGLHTGLLIPKTSGLSPSAAGAFGKKG